MPFEADLRVDFIRHGKPSYAAEERRVGEFEGELTPEGREQIAASVEELAKNINKEKEIIAIWSSPKRRARETAEIIENTLNKFNVAVIRSGEKKSLKDVKITTEFLEQMQEKGVKDWMKYWVETENLPDGVETPRSVKKRTERVITYLERIARTINPPENKKLHFICVGHEETVRDLLEEALDTGTQKGTGPNYGEIVRMDIKKSESEKDAVLDLSYRNLKAKLGWNSKERKFYKNAGLQT